MKLYTTLVRAKQVLNDGRLPPMTPIPQNVRHFIDPTFTPGLGALEEDPKKGLRCPIKGCGLWFHTLKRHLDSIHHEIGGSKSVRRALSLPDTAPLSSSAYRDGVRLRMLGNHIPNRATGPANIGRQRRSIRKAVRTAGWKNLRNKCEAQVANRMIDLANTLGRMPQIIDAEERDRGLSVAAKELYGSWDAALCAVGISIEDPRRPSGGRPKYFPTDVFEVLGNWHRVHGRLPRQEECGGRAIPLLPSAPAITRALGPVGRCDWKNYMELVAMRLGLDARAVPTRLAKGQKLMGAIEAVA